MLNPEKAKEKSNFRNPSHRKRKKLPVRIPPRIKMKCNYYSAQFCLLHLE